jgi:hypothetical protein
MAISTIILGVVAVVVIYLVWKWWFSSKKSAALISLHNAKSEHRIGANRLGKSTQSYSYSIWIAVEDWNYRFGEKKIVFSRTQGGVVGPQVSLGAQENSVSVEVGTFPGGAAEECTMQNVPLQRWVNIIVVLHNKALDVYLDGKLVKTCILQGVPKIGHTAPVYVCPDGGFSGSISNFRFFNYAMNPRQAYEIYREGYSGANLSFLEKYRLKLAFMKNNHEIGSLEI